VSGELAAVLLIGAVHVAAFCVLIWAMLDTDRGELRGWWPRDEGLDAPRPDPGPAPTMPMPQLRPADVEVAAPPEPARVTEPA
jgi:hypothetical protein